MTDKCRRMNRREEYITTEITHIWETTKKKREAQRKEGGSYVTERSWGYPSSSEGSLLPGTLGRPILCVFHPQNKPSPYQSPTFEPTLYKFIVMGSVRKPWLYNRKYNFPSKSLISFKFRFCIIIFNCWLFILIEWI